jgi:hypothetical protein
MCDIEELAMWKVGTESEDVRSTRHRDIAFGANVFTRQPGLTSHRAISGALMWPHA